MWILIHELFFSNGPSFIDNNDFDFADLSICWKFYKSYSSQCEKIGKHVSVLPTLNNQGNGPDSTLMEKT
jgi:hypothetical protein